MRIATLSLSAAIGVASCWGGSLPAIPDASTAECAVAEDCSANNIDLVTCTAGVCDGTCAPGYADCDGDKQSNGCESGIDSDPESCGGCGPCSDNNVPVRTCTAGVCDGACASDAADCDDDKRTNGCELVRTTPAAEGEIGSPCPCGDTGSCTCTTGGVVNGLTCWSYSTYPVPGGCSRDCVVDSDCGPGNYCFRYSSFYPGVAPDRCAHACIDDSDCAAGTHCISDTRTGALKRCESTRYSSVGENGVCPEPAAP
jgi:hypothetical protein